MVRLTTVLLAPAVFLVVASTAAMAADRARDGTFLVTSHKGPALLGPDGKEIERLESITNAAAGLSPDGQWVAFSKSEPASSQGTLVIQSRVHPEERTTVPLVWGTTGSSFLPIWSSDSTRILICEQGSNEDGGRDSAYRVYDLAKKDLTELKVPNECWVNDWSADGKRLLTTLQTEDDTSRIAWINADGTGSPEFITPYWEVAYFARLSPDGQRVLCMSAPKARKGDRSDARLCVIDLSTKKQTIVDEPGETHGYCWSSDGSRIAYTWQRSLEKPTEVAEREILLMTCDSKGNDRKTVTSRKHEVPPNNSGRSGVVIFFEVFAWR